MVSGLWETLTKYPQSGRRNERVTDVYQTCAFLLGKHTQSMAAHSSQKSGSCRGVSVTGGGSFPPGGCFPAAQGPGMESSQESNRSCFLIAPVNTVLYLITSMFNVHYFSPKLMWTYFMHFYPMKTSLSLYIKAQATVTTG